MSDYFCTMSFNRKLFRADREKYGSRDKLAGAIGTTGTTISNWETTDAEPGLYLLEKAARELGHTIGYYMEEQLSSTIDTSEFEGVLSKEKIESIVNAPFRASINTEQAKDMSDEEILMALQETQKRIILYELRDELKKELERRKQ